MSKLQNWRLKGSFIGANKNLTAMRCSGSLRFGVIFRDKNTTYVICFNVKSLLLYWINSYSTKIMCISQEIFITKKFSFIVRLLYFVCIRNILRLNYER